MNTLVIHWNDDSIYRTFRKLPKGAGKSVSEMNLGDGEDIPDIMYTLRQGDWLTEDSGPNLIVMCGLPVKDPTLRCIYAGVHRHDCILFACGDYAPEQKRAMREAVEKCFLLKADDDRDQTVRTMLTLSRSGFYGEYRIENGEPVQVAV